MRNLLVCDRSGGHIFPALVMAKKIKQANADDEINFFVTSEFFKNYLTKEGFPVYGRSFRSRNLFIEMFYRFFEAIHLIFKLRPQRIIGFGGRDSIFLILFGVCAGIDTAIYEPNVIAGKANSFLASFVKKIYCGFGKLKDNKKYIVVGIPLRENIKKMERKDALAALGFHDKPTIFCFGGSQGSSFLNNIFTKCVQSLGCDCQIIHLTGQRECFKISEFYNKIEQKSFVKDFYYSMETLYGASDIVVCRAGASTLAEISYYKLPAVLIPHPAAGGHQKANAGYFADKSAAYMFSQDDFDFEEFKHTIKNLLEDHGLRQKIKSNLNDIKIGINFENFCKDINF